MLDQALKAIAEPRRREILRLLQDGQERSAGDIADRFPDVSRPAISQHLQVLVESNLLAVRKDGTKRLYHAPPGALADLRAFLETFWDERLWRLKLEAESEEQEQRRQGGQPRRGGDKS
jgi:DNA-binding transcriptional ArsR family regulator